MVIEYNFKFERQCIIMIGNIGSGKSTETKIFQDTHIIVSRDKLRYMFGNGIYVFHKAIEPTVNKATKFIVDSLMQEGVNILVDETNVSKILRKDYIDMAKLYGYKTIAYELPRLSMETSVDRRMNDPHGQPDRKVWESVWKRFDSIYDEPTMSEGFDIIHKVINN